MPRIISYTPAWLSRPSPGFQLFNTVSQKQGSRSRTVDTSDTQGEYVGPNRIIARRNTEIFVVVGKQIRWADLPSLKDQWHAMQETPSKKTKGKLIEAAETHGEEDTVPEDGSYRVLKASIGEPIRQICISPNDKLMAIVTSHTVHIAILPKPDLLNAQHNKEPLKLKIFTIGPTTHVLSQSSIANVLWHPLGEGGNCLVTVTTDAVVRLWEFNIENRWSADSPALAIDLKKLAVATSEEDDVLPNRSGSNKVFTADAAGMDVASACFGGAGYGDESPWSAMTLWIGMQGGDIYALCPLLPARWQPPSNLIPTLSTAIIENKASKEPEGQADAFAAYQDKSQFRWIHALDSQEPFLSANDGDQLSPIEVYKRPIELSPIPRLQGPFQVLPEEGEELELTDIHVVAAKVSDDADHEDDTDSEYEPSEEETGLSSSLICLMTKEGRVYVCLDLEGVEAQWLPHKPLTQYVPPPDAYLIVLEGLDTLKPGEDCPSEWPTFSQDAESRYSFFTTHSRGVYYFSFIPWLSNLEKELQNSDIAGIKFRLEMLRNSLSTLRERIFSFDQPADAETEPSIPACLTMQDSDLGYFLLTISNSQPQAAILDKPYLEPLLFSSETSDYLPEMNAQIANVAYPPYQPSPAFYTTSSLPNFLDTHVPARHKRIMKEEIRLSTATLDLMTEAHRVLSKETHQLGVAAADLFRRCDQLLEVLRNQILKAGEVAERVDRVTGNDAEGLLDGIEGEGRLGTRMEERIRRAKLRQERLVERCEALRRNVKKIEGRELSLKEKEWKAEIESVGLAVQGQERVKEAEDDSEGEEKEEGEVAEEDGGEDGEEEKNGEYEEDEAEHLQRYREVQYIARDLLQQAKDISTDTPTEPSSPVRKKENHSVPTNLRRRKVMEVKKMLEKETLLVEQTKTKLEQLSLATIS